MCKLTDRFDKKDISWKVITCKYNNGTPWALLTPYLNASAVQQRLDDVFGWDNWKSEYKVMDTYVICYLSAYSENRGWVTKENVCEIDTEQNNPIKSAYSGAFKRVALEFGIGRYLKGYKTYAKNCCENPQNKNEYIMCSDKSAKKNFFALLPNETELQDEADEKYDTPNKNGKAEIIDIPTKDIEIEEDKDVILGECIGEKRAAYTIKFINDTMGEKAGKTILGIKKFYNLKDFKDLKKSALEYLESIRFDIAKLTA